MYMLFSLIPKFLHKKKYIETLKENILLDIFNYKDNQQGTEDEEELI